VSPSTAPALGALALAAGLALAGCDNPACVFGGQCSGGGDEPEANPATVPIDHAWIAPGAPTITSFFPRGTGITTDTPIAVVFSESIAPNRLAQSFLLFQTGAPAPMPTLPPTLVADGRMLIVIPAVALTAGEEYTLEFAENAIVTDLQGAAVPQPQDGIIGTFTVAAANPPAPRVVTSFPTDGATNQSATGEVVVVFDRRMNAGTIDNDSFAVTVNGVEPADNPLPQSLLLVGGGTIVPDTRVWRYRSTDADGEAVPFPTSASVEVRLSAPGERILASDGGQLPETVIDYDTAAFGAPLGADIVSIPTDAIGIDNLDGTVPLELGVELSAAQSDDFLCVYLFGGSPQTDGETIALYREAKLSSLGFDPLLQTASLREAQLDIASSTSPVTARFANGELAIALQVRRGNTRSPVRLLDVDAGEPGRQDALLDVTRPTFTGFGSSGTEKASYRSNLRDLVVVGRASEEIAIAEVASALGSNGALAPVVESASSGLFVAQPAPVGVVDPGQLPLPFTLTIYDRARNRASAAVSAQFRQVGVIGPGAALPGAATVEIEVVDARTYAAIEDALVFVHQDVAGTVTFVDSDVTDPSGFASLTAAPAGETLVTVDAAGYDLFTFHGVPESRLSIPVSRTAPSPSILQGVLATTSADLPSFDRLVADTRQFAADEPVLVVGSCSLDPQSATFRCPFNGLLRAGPAGGMALVAVDPPTAAALFTAPGFLRAYALDLPQPATSPGGAVTASLDVSTLLDDAGVDQEERAIDGPAVTLDASAVAGIALASLDGEPRVDIRASVAGLDAPVLAGFGAALDPVGSPASSWTVRTALPGVADPDAGDYVGDEVGELVEAGTFDADLFLRCEVRDTLGNRAGRRARFSVVPSSVVPSSVAIVASPAAGSTTAGPSYDVTFSDVIPSGSGQSGLYRVTLVGTSGRQWVLYRLDATGAARTVHVPDIGAAGGAPLPSGAIACSVSSFAWPGFAAAPLAFTDVDREHDLFSESAPIGFSQP
jgi:hypothetical protein